MKKKKKQNKQTKLSSRDAPNKSRKDSNKADKKVALYFTTKSGIWTKALLVLWISLLKRRTKSKKK